MFVQMPNEVLTVWCPFVFISLSRVVMFTSLKFFVEPLCLYHFKKLIWKRCLHRSYIFIVDIPMFEVISGTMKRFLALIPVCGDLIFTSLKSLKLLNILIFTHSLICCMLQYLFIYPMKSLVSGSILEGFGKSLITTLITKI